MPQTIEAFDWETTPLGAIGTWPPALRTAYDVMMGTGFAACAIWGPDQTLLYNQAYIPFLGARHPTALGRPIAEVWHDIWDDIGPLIDRTQSGERIDMQDMHLLMSRNGYPEDTYWTFSYSPLRDGDRIMGMLNIAIETTGRVAAERNNARVLTESTHRLKNTLAIVQAIAHHSLRHVADRSVVKGFEERLQALASAQDVLHQRDWSTADLGVLIDTTLAKVMPKSAYALDGPLFAVSARVAQNVCLVMHELATNAIKHGAWSRDGGRVEVRWRSDADVLRLEWREHGGPPVVAPTQKSFGSKLISGGLAGAGRVETRFDPAGLIVSFAATIDSLQET